MDKRSLRSKKAVRQALIRLSATRPYTEITVRELCREAGISRSTFYYNYHTPNDVISEISAEYMKKIRGSRLTREFFAMLTENGDELDLLLRTGIFGHEFGLYLKEMLAGEISSSATERKNELALNVKVLYHAFGIFGVLQNLGRLYGTPNYLAIRTESINTLMELIGRLSAE